MRQDAEANAEEDRLRKELIEVRNNADNTAYSAEKLLNDLGDKVPAELKSQVEDGVAKVREALNTDDADAIRTATDSLSEILQQVGAAAYQQAGPEAAAPGADPEPGPETPPEGGDEDVVDGEFRSA